MSLGSVVSAALAAVLVDAASFDIAHHGMIEARYGAQIGANPKWVQYFSEGANGAPEQLWINYGYTPDQMVIGWLTSDMNAATNVRYGTASGNYVFNASGTSDYYVYSSKYTSGLIHHTTLSNLQLNTTYFYVVGQDGAWSSEYSFTSSPGVGAIFPYTIAYTADVGESENANDTITHLYERMPYYDSIMINGDISYATGCEKNGCNTWDAFQRMTQVVSARKPWHVNIGNHECDDTANGKVAISTRYRFSGMPYPQGSPDDVFYFSYSAGPAHVISISSFYPRGYGSDSPLVQWLQKDLATVDRAVTPWILVTLHAPWYNSNTAHHLDGEEMRKSVEPILLAAGVNAVFGGHVHAYERSTPVANNVVQPNGQGIVHFNIGDGGAGLYTGWYPTPAWSAYHEATWGHGEFSMTNATHATWTWHRNQDSEPTTADSYTLRNTHTSGRYTPIALTAAAPEQIHIAYTGVPGQVSVDFVSSASAQGSVTFGGPGQAAKTIPTSSFYFNTVGYMHQAVMTWTGLHAGEKVWYSVSAGGATSANFTVTPIPARHPQDVFAVFGDFGLVNDVIMAKLTADAQSGVFDSVLHVGDWAYDLEDSGSSVGNQFMNLVQGYAAQVPVMPAVGNHEACGSCAAVPILPYSNGNFTQYRARMHSVEIGAGQVSGSYSSVYYSFEEGLTHFLVISAEAYTYNSGPEFLAAQLSFMEMDLARVDRSKTPWVVVLVHKDWTMEKEAFDAFYPVMDKGGVDFLFCGHIHYYMRNLPYDAVTGDIDYASASGPNNTVYTNPKYLVNIVTGASGDKEGETPCIVDILPPAQNCNTDYGYGLFTAVNATHATWSFTSVATDWPWTTSNFTDSLTVIKTAEGRRRQ